VILFIERLYKISI